MRAGLWMAVAGMVLTSCTFFPTPVARTPFPTLTPVAIEIFPAATQAGPVALFASPTASPVIFRDDFHPSMESGWDWRGNDPKNISLMEQRGSLRLNAVAGYASDDQAASLLLRPAPEGDFQIETRLVFTPLNEPQFAGLVIFQSRRAYMQAGRGTCRGGPVCLGDGLYFDRFTDARLLNNGLSLRYREGDTVYLRLERRGTTYTFYASPNNIIWQPIGKRQSEILPLYVGLFAGQNNDLPIPAFFDYFQISEVGGQ